MEPDYKKLYTEAVERAKSAWGSGAYDDATMEFIFPQLKDSPDERTRKRLINLITDSVTNNEGIYLSEGEAKIYISWLMRKKEKSLSDEDKAIIEDAIYFIKEYRSKVAKDENDFQNAVTCENWLSEIDPDKIRHPFTDGDKVMLERIRPLVSCKANGPIDEMSDRQYYLDLLNWINKVIENI